MSRRPWPVVFVVLGAAVHLVVWLVVRPDLAGPQWTDGHATEIWLALEAVLAVVLGLLAPARRELVVAVLAGWALQAAHFASSATTTTTRCGRSGCSARPSSPRSPSASRSWLTD
jgi:hypothetical protein